MKMKSKINGHLLKQHRPRNLGFDLTSTSLLASLSDGPGESKWSQSTFSPYAMLYLAM